VKNLKYHIAVILLTAGTTASAEQISGRQLLAFCNGSDGAEGKRYCDGYITAAIETHATWALWNRLKPVFCFPEGDKFDHAFGVIIPYLQNHPGELNFEASSLVLNSLNEAFPCE
jgi:Rap1a immunity proteins